MERILQEEGIEARAMTWEQLGYEVGLECAGQTVKNAMGCMTYRKCIACKKGWVNEKTARDRKAWAQMTKEKYPKPENWYRVRFSDEVHFGYGPQGKLRIIRKPGERYCSDCIQEERNRRRRIRSAIIVGLRWPTISNLIYIFMRCREIPTGRCVKKSTLTRFFKRLWSPGLKHITILFWKKMVTRVMDRENPTLYGRGRSQMA